MKDGSSRPIGPGDAFERLGVLEALGYGTVWEGKLFHGSQAEPLTLLELDRALLRERDGAGRWLEELDAWCRVSGPEVAACHGVWTEGEDVYVVWEALSGLSLARAFDLLGALGARLSTEAVLRITGAVLASLDRAASLSPPEQGAHGLLTPANVFLAEGQRVLVRGFGLWPAVAQAGLLGPTDSRYLAPGQWKSGHASAGSDLFSVAVLLFELVCGLPAFDGPADEEGLSSLKESIAERRKAAEPPLFPLYDAMLACLSPALAAPAFRTRLRKILDTLFLDEFSRERPAKSLTIGDLLARVKPRRPVVVKARALALVAFSRRPSTAVALPPAAAPAAEAVPEAAAASSPPKPPLSAAASASITKRLNWRVVAVGGAAALLLSAVALLVWPRRASRLASEARAVPVVSYAPGPVLPGSPSPSSEGSSAATRPAAAVEKTGDELSATPPRTPEAKRSGDKGGRKGAAASAARRPEPPPTTAVGVDAASAVPSATPVAPGTLVALDSTGLSRPLVAEQPEMPRYGADGARPTLPRSALLEILVDERGRVRDSRILQVESPPAGFSAGVQRYLEALRFEPARLGGVPVRVWIPYELKYAAP